MREMQRRNVGTVLNGIALRAPQVPDPACLASPARSLQRVVEETYPLTIAKAITMKTLIGAVALALLVGNAVATPVSGTDGVGTPTIAGQTGIANFDSIPLATRSSVTSGAVTVSGIGGSIRVANDYPGQYNGRGAAYLDNDQGATSGFRFDFASIVNAFAFNFGASDEIWTLTAFDASGHIIESVRAPVTNGSNAGDYIGLADPGIKYATLTTSFNDWVFVDNFVYAAALVRSSAVPEPGSIALIGLGIAGVVGMRRRKGLA